MCLVNAQGLSLWPDTKDSPSAPGKAFEPATKIPPRYRQRKCLSLFVKLKAKFRILDVEAYLPKVFCMSGDTFYVKSFSHCIFTLSNAGLAQLHFDES